MALAAAAIICLAPGVRAQAAEAEWYRDFPGFGVPDFGSRPRPQDKRADAEKPSDAANDLRPHDIPWRSDETLQAIDIALETYQQIANKGGWPEIPRGRTMRPGDDDERIPKVRRLLRVTGDLGGRRQSTYYASFESFEFDGELEAAVRRFQQRHGLRVSGRVDRPTIEAMNVPVEARLSQLTINRDRIRALLQQQFDDRYILVNVPAFQLEAVDKYEVQDRHRVIVGRPDRQTPELRATIRGVNFFPFWRVPDSVAQLDLIPRMQKEPTYLEAEKIRVFEGYNGPEVSPSIVDWTTADASKLKFRQDPGLQNALGLVRIDMPNEHIVYMHDTPLKKLFEQRGRAFSAGCIRVHDVMKLVGWIIQHESGWENPERIEQTLADGQPVDVQLSRPIPVQLAYITAWAEPDGRVEFRPDIYNRDGSQELAAGIERDPDEAPLPPPSLAP